MTTYEEYVGLRRQIGYDPNNAICEEVWNRCTSEAQEDMLNQFRPQAKAAQERAERYGDTW